MMRLRILELPPNRLGEASETPYALIFDRCGPAAGLDEQISSGKMRETTGAAFVLAFAGSVDLGEGEPDAPAAIEARREPPADRTWLGITRDPEPFVNAVRRTHGGHPRGHGRRAALMRQTTPADLGLDETAELIILEADDSAAHKVTGVLVTNTRMSGGPSRGHIALSGDSEAARWLIDQPDPSVVRATYVQGSTRVNCTLDGWQLRRVDPCPTCTHRGSVLDTWWKPIDAVIGAPAATSGTEALRPQP